MRDVREVVDETGRVVVRRVPERPFHVIHRSFVLIHGVFFHTRCKAGNQRADRGASRASYIARPSLEQRRERRRRFLLNRSALGLGWSGRRGRRGWDGALVDGRGRFHRGGHRARHQRPLRPRLVVQTLSFVNLPATFFHDPLHALPRLVVTLAVHSLERPEQRRVLARANPGSMVRPGGSDVFAVRGGVRGVRHGHVTPRVRRPAHRSGTRVRPIGVDEGRRLTLRGPAQRRRSYVNIDVASVRVHRSASVGSCVAGWSFVVGGGAKVPLPRGVRRVRLRQIHLRVRADDVRALLDQPLDQRQDENPVALTLAQGVEQLNHGGTLAPLGENGAGAGIGARLEDPIEQQRRQRQVSVHRDARDVQRRCDDWEVRHTHAVDVRAALE